jgi:hypothetical protein
MPIFAFLLRNQGLFLKKLSKFVHFKKNIVADNFFFAADELSKFGNKQESENKNFESKLKLLFKVLAILCKIPFHFLEGFYVTLLIKLLQITRASCFLSFYLSKVLFDFLYLVKIQEVPGTKLLAIADFLFKKQTVEGVFNQIVVDWRNDYFDALSEKRNWKARWISFRGHYEFYSAMFKQSPIGDLIEEVRKFVK